MTLPLPHGLLLFGLDDEKGTVHSAAFLALDHALRGAVLAELKLRGRVQARANGDLRWRPTKPPTPLGVLMSSAVVALDGQASPAAAEAWLATLARRMPDLRVQLTARLQADGVLGSADRDGGGVLPDRVIHPASDDLPEGTLREQVIAGLDAGDRIPPRLGMLVGFVVACHLEEVVFGTDADEARRRADWVAERDAILRATRGVIAEAEGY